MQPARFWFDVQRILWSLALCWVWWTRRPYVFYDRLIGLALMVVYNERWARTDRWGDAALALHEAEVELAHLYDWFSLFFDAPAVWLEERAEVLRKRYGVPLDRKFTLGEWTHQPLYSTVRV